MQPVAIVQHEPSVPPGLIGPVLAGSDIEIEVIEAWRTDEWPDASAVGGLIVLGGTMNVDQLAEYPFLRRSRALMADAIDHGIPTLGVCLGAQMMSRVLGGAVRKCDRRNAVFSRLEVSDEGISDPIVGAIGETPVLQFHEDTFELPPNATPLAASTHSHLIQAFRYGDSAYGIQFHFEVDDDIVEGWMEQIGAEAMSEQWGSSPEQLRDQLHRYLPAQEVVGRTIVERFADLVRDQKLAQTTPLPARFGRARLRSTQLRSTN